VLVGLQRNFYIHGLPETGLQIFAVAAAKAELGPVVEDEFVFGIAVEAKFADAIEIHDGGPVNTAESGRIEIGFEIVHAASDKVCFPTDVK
jgi:hypothetical protein